MLGFWSPSSYMVSAEPFPDRSRPMWCKLAQMGSRPMTFLWLWPVSDHEPHCWHVPINKIWRRTQSTPRSRWWCSHMGGIHSSCSTREMSEWKMLGSCKTVELLSWNIVHITNYYSWLLNIWCAITVHLHHYLRLPEVLICRIVASLTRGGGQALVDWAVWQWIVPTACT